MSPCSPEQIVLTHGTSQALDLVIKRLVRPGDAVLILTGGHYRKYVEHLRERVDQARAGMLRLLKTVGMQVFAEPASGNFVWARFAHIEDAATLSESALRDGVMLAPGAVFRPNLEPSAYLRFNVAFHGDPGLRRVLGRIAQSARAA